MINFFKNEKLQRKFNRDGFVILPFLDEGKVNFLKKLYAHCYPNGTQGFYSSSFTPEYEKRKEISDEIGKVFQNKVDDAFTHYKKLGSQFLIKNPGEKGKMPFHQDWTVVDESQFCSVTIWVPLQDITPENGAIRLLRGSHTFSGALRSPTLPDMFANVHEEIEQYSETLTLKAGEAFIFNHALIHGSHLNKSEFPRLAVAYGLVPKDAELVFYYRENENSGTEKYLMPDSFFIDFFNDGKRPKIGTFLETVDPKLNLISKDQFFDKLLTRNKNMIRPIFKDPSLQHQFDEKGFIKIPLLDKDEVEKLMMYYHHTKKEIPSGYGFHISLDDNTSDEVKGIFETLFSTLMPKLEPLLDNCKAFTASYVIKEPGLENIVPPHQDWTFVDEREFCSATVWVPLMDVIMENGALGVIPGSHKFFDYPRSSPSPQSKSPLADHIFTIFPYIQMIEMKAGEALIFNNRTIHASPPNTTDQPRIAAGIGITQNEAQLIHCYQLPNQTPEKIEIYDVEKEFFTQYNNKRLSDLYDSGNKPQDQKCVSIIQRNVPTISSDDMKSLILSVNGNSLNETLVSYLKALYHDRIGGSEKNNSNTEEVAVNTTNEQKRSFFQTYTPSNIIAEIKWRLTGKNN